MAGFLSSAEHFALQEPSELSTEQLGCTSVNNSDK